MGLRFRRSVKIAPGLRLNFSKSGVSTSLGVRGAHVTIGHGKLRETVGLPGTGISYTEVHGADEHHVEQPATRPPGVLATAWNLFFLMVVLGVVLAIGYACGTMIR